MIQKHTHYTCSSVDWGGSLCGGGDVGGWWCFGLGGILGGIFGGAFEWGLSIFFSNALILSCTDKPSGASSPWFSDILSCNQLLISSWRWNLSGCLPDIKRIFFFGWVKIITALYKMYTNTQTNLPKWYKLKTWHLTEKRTHKLQRNVQYTQ